MNRNKKYTVCLALIFFFIICRTIVPQQAGYSDGPYVFYKNNKIIVKTITGLGDSARVTEKIFRNKSQVVLSCYVAETGDKFNVNLHKYGINKSEYALPEKIFAISDIHANFKGLKEILIGAGVINNKLQWSFGKGHFVFDGDIFDRGTNPAECIWLIYKLEKEAKTAGGMVHYIIGNHEILNLSGNTKYVNKNILENAPLLKEEYKNLYNENTELGRWFRTKNGIEKIGSYLFVHGGINPRLDSLKLSLDKINEITRGFLGKAKEELTGEYEKLLCSGIVSPYWFRGLVINRIPQEAVDKILTDMKADKIIVGHTIIDEICTYFDGRVVAINEDHQKNSDNGFMHGLLIIGKKFYIIDNKGNTKEIK